ncbi:MerR family transcriptional regulator [Schaalia sp. 19OD2882]|uniref:MerR family transcriptional regulator n=1 Tax=Schaalia sp. 19OD2882 TaxID=2794089 RepID=UPI001C1EAC73|nr:MerR family transcriptional regulator [Schaalia sp. 19OD2882]QWW19206.1 MerR family transcriptional regulator [Schaalia sp. 19OD2882]
MSRAHFVTIGKTDAPLSVAALALRLGVPPSTLRTWERRYGLGVSDRQAGAHRRYLPEDVERLARMVELVHSGVPTGDAAALVLAESARNKGGADGRRRPTRASDLVRAATEDAPETLVRIIRREIAEIGLVRTWTRLIEPAIEAIRSSDVGEDPGHAPSASLTVACLQVLREVADEGPHPDPDAPTEVLVLTDQDHCLGAHVLGVALEWQGLCTRIVATGSGAGRDGCDRVKGHLARHAVRICLLMGSGATCEELVDALAHEHDLDVILVGANTPAYLDPKVQRVRTLGAALEETLSVAGVDLS